MAKERKTAEQLAVLIVQQLNIGGVIIKVMRHLVDGWSAVAIVEPSQTIAVQVEVENIVSELRRHYDLTA